MKNWWLIPLALVAGIVLGRLSVEPKVVTETVTEYHTLNTSALTAIKVSEPIGSRIERVKMLGTSSFLNIGRADDVQEVNFPNINQIGDSTEMVKNYLRDSTKKVEGLSNGCLMGLSNSQPVTNCPQLDSATIELPIRDYTFTDDSTYRITARGVYVESLPQIQLFPKTTTTTRTETVVRTPRVSHGIQIGGGIAYTPKGLQPSIYLGYGLNIRF